MSALVILTSTDTRLIADWGGGLQNYVCLMPDATTLARELAQGGARVWVKDIADSRCQLPAHADVVTIVVGQPQSLPFEQARLAHAGNFFLGYEESRTRLREIMPLAAELAEKKAIIRTLEARAAHTGAAPVRAANPPAAAPLSSELGFIEAAIEHLDNRARLVEEFQRAALSFVRATRVTVFLREADHFRCESPHWSAPINGPFARRLEEYPCVVDLDDWAGVPDAATETDIRLHMRTWGARMIVPMQENGRLDGWVAFGPRADGRPYDAADQARALQLGRLFERCLEKSRRLRASAESAEIEHLRSLHLPGARILGANAPSDPSLPPEIRALAGEVLRTGAPATLTPSPTVRFRAEAGPAGPQRVWVRWHPAAAELSDRLTHTEQERIQLCRELGLTLSHELGSPLVSLMTYLQLSQQQGTTPELLAEFNAQLASGADRLRDLATVLKLMQEFMAGATASVDMAALVRGLNLHGKVRVEPNEFAPVIQGNETMLRFAMQTIVNGLVRDRRAEDGLISLAVKQRGHGADEVTLVVFSGRGLLLEGFIEDAQGALPVHPLLAVFLSREIVRWHHGVLQAGQGLVGPEIQIALRSRVQGAGSVAASGSPRASNIDPVRPQ